MGTAESTMGTAKLHQLLAPFLVLWTIHTARLLTMTSYSSIPDVIIIPSQHCRIQEKLKS